MFYYAFQQYSLELIYVPENTTHEDSDIALAEKLPPAEPGHAWSLRDGVPVQVIDLRSKPLYRKSDGASEMLFQVGPLPDHLTEKPRPGIYYVWRNDDWVLDTEAERAGLIAQVEINRDNRLREVVIRVAPLQYAVDLNEASLYQVTYLEAWKRYAVKLSLVELQSGYPSTIDWPVAPAKVVVTPAA
ncbi:tail fiber assembly protein [Pseudomonas atagonensis]|uniref:tail fiber assembly protein n=1 Tax=Pseudomonas atagonensis TaxID=2609964 RepID=UPI00140BE4CC|nr:tail fiber assembly protein [Pseudomonas atagonensis]